MKDHTWAYQNTDANTAMQYFGLRNTMKIKTSIIAIKSFYWHIQKIQINGQNPDFYEITIFSCNIISLYYLFNNSAQASY